ncbi:MAG TPA: prolyl oligopeptidase family serine peptidase [Intrasporangium sp.]|uniref:alpha/beta hydrolase family protein n=1 Tax=Intrasporangium sp. TaxID=1925024 RepID=UPI002D7913D2|nr:prolyl oligopeptidase family serine peptidase [Intrasporangium sp.]HET7396984.1 prolyl oligopeptidase family serine peptidase [Intrasporangium sp.]
MRRLVTRPVLVAGAVGGGSAVGAGLGSLAAAAYFARKVVTPDVLLPDDVTILAVGSDTVTFAAGPDPLVPGRYGVWLDGGVGHLRVGDITALDGDTVTRRLLAVDRGTPRVGPARWNQYYYWDRPSVSLGLPDEDAAVPSEVGALPGWVVRPEPSVDRGDWAVLVHGRGARKEETLRAVPVLRAAGYTSLVTAYRNDHDAPSGPDGRYNLGLSEWRDVEAAMAYAVSRGALRIVLCGWSMGGAIALQVLDNSPLAARVDALVLDSAVLDWRAVLRHHARLNRLPGWLVRVATELMGERHARRLVGVHEPLDVARTDWVARSAELRHPMLVIHSDGDDFVPIGPAVHLAARRPDLVRFDRWQQARHCREWNLDPGRWEGAVRDFLAGLDAPTGAGAGAGWRHDLEEDV